MRTRRGTGDAPDWWLDIGLLYESFFLASSEFERFMSPIGKG